MGEAITADWKEDKDGDRMMDGDKVFHILMTRVKAIGVDICTTIEWSEFQNVTVSSTIWYVLYVHTKT